MAEMDREMQELKREVIEARNLVIKTDNVLKNLHTEIKGVAEKLRVSERQRFATSATAYFLIAALAVLGAYMYARGELRAKNDELARTREERDTIRKTLDEAKAIEKDTRDESSRALELFERMAGADDIKRNKALTEVATMQPARLSPLEVRALRDKAASLRQEVANDALESGRQAFTRRDYRNAAEELGRYVTLATGKIDDNALYMLGQARYVLKDYKGAIEPMQAYLKAVPYSKVGDYATMVYAESLSESGEKQKAIQVYRTGADRYYDGQYASTMRNRARRIETELRGGSLRDTAQPNDVPPAAPAPAPAPAPTPAPAPAADAPAPSEAPH